MSQNSQQIENNERLGVAELGKFAQEDRMPRWMEMMLQLRRGHANDNVVSSIALILQRDPAVSTAYLCDEATQHISKTRIEVTEVPSILEIQALIEKAWDSGILAENRIKTGGILKTRKYIGTPEVYALFTSLNIPSRTYRFVHQEGGKTAYSQLIDVVLAYFKNGTEDNLRENMKIHQTKLSPIYLQQPGHSVIIIGIEKRDNHDIGLLVFDPDYRYPDRITKLLAQSTLSKLPKLRDHVVSYYRFGDQDAAKYSEIEIIYPHPF